MPAPIISLFCKTAECPTSQALLAYHRSTIDAEGDVHIKDHLAACDFCSAELQLLTQYRNDIEAYSFVEMPSPLRRLAEDLLKTRPPTIRGFSEIGESPQLLH